MKSSVLLTGDAGGVKYIKEVPKNTFKFCCSCTLPKDEIETNLTPLKNPKRGIQKKQRDDSSPRLKSRRPPSQEYYDAPQWRWSHDIVARYSNTETMKKGFYQKPQTRKSIHGQPMGNSGRR